jgi:hypothetical protein
MKIYTYENAVVGPHGIVFDRNQTPVESTIERFKYYNNAQQWSNSHINFDENKDIHKITGEYIHMLHPYDLYPYGHIREPLTTIYYLQDHACRNILINRCHFNDPEGQVKMWACMGYTDESVCTVYTQPHEKRPYYHVEKLHIPDRKFNTLSNQSLTYVKQKLKKMVIDMPIHENIYISRPCDTKRGVVNDMDVCNLLKEYNFYIFTGEESLSEQITLFNNAKCVIGAHGAGMFNTLYCNKATKIFEFTPVTRFNRMFKDQSNIIHGDNNNHFIIGVESVNKHNIRLDLNLLRHIINNN